MIMNKVRETDDFYFEELERDGSTSDYGTIYSCLKATQDARNAGKLAFIFSSFSLIMASMPIVYGGEVRWTRIINIVITCIIMLATTQWGHVMTLKTRLGKSVSPLSNLLILVGNLGASFLTCLLVLGMLISRYS